MSKYLKQAEKVSVPRHRHCIVCATPISLEKEFCGSICEDQYKRVERKRKYQLVIPMLIMFPVLFLLLFLMHH
jgi:predicted nucleic acid-binding Zn ribbon protein